jgi:Polyketide cyclase / dehydrase and lipid transport
MASIRKDIPIEADPDHVWAAVRDVGAVHERLGPGFLTDSRLDGEARVVTFANGMVVRELIVNIDDQARRFVWAAVGGEAPSPQRVDAGLCRRRGQEPPRVDRGLPAG